MDGLLLDVTGWEAQEVVDGVLVDEGDPAPAAERMATLLMSDHGQFGPGGRSGYEPAPEPAPGAGLQRFTWRGDWP
ncbi:hypothetical protein ACFWNE_31455 [Streptomyces goshikiensis]|uniref:hypothetical protein n=1 Tax=Streptomyces goshikiensis TaxID=1942 RepID=UPI00364A78D8